MNIETIETTANTITEIWRVLQDGRYDPSSPREIAAQARKIADVGWVYTVEAEEFLCALGLPWDLVNYALENIPTPRRAVYKRSDAARYNSPLGFQGISSADLAAFVIMLERFGLAIDPSPLVDAIKPVVRAQKMITDGELDVFRYAAERHTNCPVALLVKDAPVAEGNAAHHAVWTGKSVWLMNGYKVFSHIVDGKITGLRIDPPKRGARSTHRSFRSIA